MEMASTSDEEFEDVTFLPPNESAAAWQKHPQAPSAARLMHGDPAKLPGPYESSAAAESQNKVSWLRPPSLSTHQEAMISCILDVTWHWHWHWQKEKRRIWVASMQKPDRHSFANEECSFILKRRDPDQKTTDLQAHPDPGVELNAATHEIFALPMGIPEPEQVHRLADVPIGQRTRARNPLDDVTIEELEAMLLEDDVPNSDGDDEEAYHQFLQVDQLQHECIIVET